MPQMFPPKPTFSVDQIPDLSGRVMLITGGNSGIGKETCKVLLSKGATVYIGVRDVIKGRVAIEELKKQTGREAHLLELDLADLSSVRRAAERFKSKEGSLHALFNNAGVMIPPIDRLTVNGYDLQFGTNVLGHFFLTKLLLPTLIATAKTSGQPSRITFTTSGAHEFCKLPLDYAAFRDGPARRKLGPSRLYAQSKFCDVVLAVETSRRYGDQGIVALSLDPGNVQTDLQRETPSWVKWLLDRTLLYPLSLGVLTQAFAGTMPEVVDLNGKHLWPWARIGESHKAAQDEAEGRKLWEWLEEQVKDR